MNSMNRNKRILVGVLLLVLIIILYVVSAGTGNNTQNKKVRIGIITPLTGQYAMYGEVNKNAAKMAEEKYGKDNVEIFVEDDEYDAKKAVSAYQKLRSANNIDAVIVLGAPSIQAIKPLTDRDNIPLLGLGVTLVYEKDSVFQLMPAGERAMPESGKLYSEKYDKIVVAHSSAELFKKNADGFKKGIDPKDLIAEVSIPPASDYRTEISKILKLNPDLVTVAFPLEDSIKFLKALRVLDPERKVNIACDFTTELAPKDYIEAFGSDRLEGCISVNLAQTTTEEFKKEYKQKFGIDMIMTGDTTYDAVDMVVKLANKYPRNKWVGELSTSYYIYSGGVTGEIRFNDDGTRLDSDPVVSVFRGDGFVKIK